MTQTTDTLIEHRFRIIQNDMVVAGTSSTDRERMLAELSRYAMQYAEEGPIQVETRTGKGRWKRFVP